MTTGSYYIEPFYGITIVFYALIVYRSWQSHINVPYNICVDLAVAGEMQDVDDTAVPKSVGCHCVCCTLAQLCAEYADALNIWVVYGIIFKTL
jgi:hypothetical protein